jgi:DNA-binding beta-propeller fold protein YncE
VYNQRVTRERDVKTFLRVSSLGLAVLISVLFTSLRAHADTLYVANAVSNTIVKIDSGGNASVFASSGLSHPEGVAFDSSGNLYVANNGNGTIEKFDPSGNGSVFASQNLPFPVLSMTPMGLAFDSSGNLFVADPSHGHRILKFDPSGKASVFATGPLLGIPYALTFDGNGNLYELSEMANSIVKIDPSGNESVFASLSNSGLRTVGLTFDSSGNLYVAIDSYGVIEKFDPNGTESVFAAVYGTGRGGDLNGLAIDSSGNLYASSFEARVLKCDPSGNVSLFAGASAGLYGAGFMAFQVPEPATWLLAISGALLVCPLLRRKHA